MKILFIGGTGIISSACSQLAIERGYELTIFNRGKSERSAPEGTEVILGDIRDQSSTHAILGKRIFDVVVDWVAYTPGHIDIDLELFRDRTNQYVFISSASAYQTPPASLPISESTPLSNPYWEYSRNKIACEQYLLDAYRQHNFPITIVRPSHTYDRTLLPMHGGYTVVDRMRKGKPVIVHGDGTSLWVLTHHRDFAKGFIGLLGNPHAIGDVFHITSDELLTWNQIFKTVAQAAGVEAQIVHIPSDFIARFDSEWGAGLLGDKSHSMIFDNSKIKRLVPDYIATIPFARGADEIIAWYDADPARQQIDPDFNLIIENILKAFNFA